MREITAYGKNIIVLKEEGAKTTPGGIVLPKAKNSNWAKVISKGFDVKTAYIDDAFVLIGDYIGVEVSINDIVHHVINEDEILAYSKNNK